MQRAPLYFVSHKFQQVPNVTEVEAAETKVGHRFPGGYRAYIMTVGRGEYNGFLTLFPPAQLLSETRANREAAARYPDAYDDVVHHELGEGWHKRAVWIGETRGGDECLFLSDAPDTVYLLPDEEDGGGVMVLGRQGLEDSLDFSAAYVLGGAARYYGSGDAEGTDDLEAVDAFRYFRPSLGYAVVMRTPDDAPAPPLGDVARTLLGMRAHEHALVSEDAGRAEFFYGEAFGGMIEVWEDRERGGGAGRPPLAAAMTHEPERSGAPLLRDLLARLEILGFGPDGDDGSSPVLF